MAFFFQHTLSLFPIIFAFLKHLCLGVSSILGVAPVTLTETVFILISSGFMLSLFFTKIVTLLITAWRINHLSIIHTTGKFPQLKEFLKKYQKVNIFSSKEPSAFCYFDRIYLSSKLFTTLNKKELEAVFLHEYVHVSSFDSIRTWILELINRCLLIPFFSHFIRDFKLSIEIEADQFVEDSQGTNQFLKGALLKVIAYPNLTVTQFASSHLENRIRAMKKPSLMKRQTNVLLFSGVLVILLSFVMFFHHVRMALAMSKIVVHQEAGQCMDTQQSIPATSSLKNYSSISH